MSTVFLPFITETSSEEAIFKAVVQRTKGSEYQTLTNLFSIILKLGIKGARQKIESYPEMLTTSAKVKELIAQHPEYHVPKNEHKFWEAVIGIELQNELIHDVFSPRELITYFIALAICKPEALAGAGFEIDFEKYKKFAKEDFDSGIRSIKGIKISDKDSLRVGISSWEEFKAFIAANQNTSGDGIYLVMMPVFMPCDDKGLTKSDYERNSCESPYTYKANNS